MFIGKTRCLPVFWQGVLGETGNGGVAIKWKTCNQHINTESTTLEAVASMYNNQSQHQQDLLFLFTRTTDAYC